MLSTSSWLKRFSALHNVAMVATVYVLAWSLLPPLLSSSLPLDVVESLTWGREWQWGYYKHPPLAPWMLQMFYLAFGRVGPFLLSQLCIAATLWLVWRMGCRLMARERAFLGAVLTMGVAYYTTPALEFNHNVAQMPVWAALGYSLLACLQDGRLRQWVVLGLVAGLGMLTKYSVAVLLFCQAMYLLLTVERRVLRRLGPWLALAMMLALCAPHLYWLWQSDWLPMAYAGERAAGASTIPGLDALAFLGAQALNHLPLALIVVAALVLSRKERQAAPVVEQGRGLHASWPGYLLVLALGPGLLVTLLGAATGKNLRDMWGMPMWAFSGLLVAAWLPAHWLKSMRPRLLRGLMVWLLLISLLSGAYLAYGAQWRQRPARTDWPQAALAQHAQATWKAVANCRLDMVAGDYWLAGLITVVLPYRPSILIAGDERYSPWVTPQRLQAHGALWVWPGNTAPESFRPLDKLLSETDMPWREGLWQVDWPRAATGEPLTVYWRAYLPDDCARRP